MEGLTRGLEKNPPPIRQTFIVLPAYNEAQALSQLIPTLTLRLNAAGRPFEVIVVNDGSSDNTSSILRSFLVREICHDTNRGYGAALKTGFMWVAGHGQSADAVVTMDADNTQDPIYIPALLDQLEKGFDGVTASYVMPGGHSSGVPFPRRLMSRFLNALFRAILPLPGISTYTNGFRAYRVSALKALVQKYNDHLIDETGFPGGTEFFLKMACLGRPLTEIPFDLHYEQRGSASKIRLLSTIQKYLRLVIHGRCYVQP